MGITGFYWVLLGFTGLYWVSLGFTGFYWISLVITGFYWVLLGFSNIPNRNFFAFMFLSRLESRCFEIEFDSMTSIEVDLVFSLNRFERFFCVFFLFLVYRVFLVAPCRRSGSEKATDRLLFCFILFF